MEAEVPLRFSPLKDETREKTGEEEELRNVARSLTLKSPKKGWLV